MIGIRGPTGRRTLSPTGTTALSVPSARRASPVPSSRVADGRADRPNDDSRRAIVEDGRACRRRTSAELSQRCRSPPRRTGGTGRWSWRKLAYAAAVARSGAPVSARRRAARARARPGQWPCGVGRSCAAAGGGPARGRTNAAVAPAAPSHRRSCWQLGRRSWRGAAHRARQPRPMPRRSARSGRGSGSASGHPGFRRCGRGRQDGTPATPRSFAGVPSPSRRPRSRCARAAAHERAFVLVKDDELSGGRRPTARTSGRRRQSFATTSSPWPAGGRGADAHGHARGLQKGRSPAHSSWWRLSRSGSRSPRRWIVRHRPLR